ncbi:MAG: 6-bladed beta-propeller, partial [Betaproteobacteria bacterium]|nr:6-bladed beta-propeller [Betaproteobacteria bacterium]
MRRLLATAGIAVLLAGCAAAAPRTLHYGVEDAPEGNRLLWPRPPEVPRYLYAGQLIGEANFHREQAQPGESVRSFFAWLAGLAVGEKAPETLRRPQNGVVDERGRIYVTDVSAAAVYVFDSAAGTLSAWDRAEGLAGFRSPTGIALGPGGRVLVADAELGLIAQLDRDGNPVASIGRGVLQRPTGLAYDAARGRIYVADTQAHDIKVFDEQGTLQTVIGRRGSSEGEFNFPTYLTLAGGELYVTDSMNSRIQVLSPQDGQVRLRFGTLGLYVGNLVRPKGVAVDSDGNIYVVESYYDHLLVFNRHGEFLMGIGGAGQATGRFFLPSGVWVDSRDRVFVA